MTDPFFKARARAPGAPSWGQHDSYAEDIYRTYPPSGGKLPTRDPQAYERALKFRERELQRHQETTDQRDRYKGLLEANTSRLQAVTDTLAEVTRKYSELKLKHERATAHSGSSSELPSVREHAGEQCEGPVAPDVQPGADTDGLQPALVPEHRDCEPAVDRHPDQHGTP